MTFDIAYTFSTVLPALIAAVPISLFLMVTSGVIGNVLAVPVAVARLSRNPFLRVPAYVFILLMRGTPLLVQIYLVYYGLGQLLGPSVMRQFPFLRDGIWYAIFALSINTAGYTGEIEAARAFGMSRALVFRRVTLPRAIRICLPAMSSEMILLLKATALASTITVYEVLGTAQLIRVDTFRVYDTLIGAGVVYIAMVFLLTRVLNWIERALSKERRPIPSAAPARAT